MKLMSFLVLALLIQLPVMDTTVSAAEEDEGGVPNLAILGIRGWQLISQNTSLIDC